MFGPREGNAFPRSNNIEKKELEEAIQFLNSIFKKQIDSRPKITDEAFKNRYSNEYILQAQARLYAKNENLKNKNQISFEQGDMSEKGFQIGIERSQLFEALMADEINKGFFPRTNAFMTSEYDDKIHKTDVIGQDKMNRRLYIGFDFIVTGESTHAYEKVHDIYHDDIKTGKLAIAKFFKDNKGFAGQVHFPKFVIAGTKKDFLQYCALRRATPNNDESLFMRTPFQHDVLRQIDVQIDIYHYAIEDGFITSERTIETITTMTEWFAEIKRKTGHDDLKDFANIKERLDNSSAIKGVETFRDNI